MCVYLCPLVCGQLVLHSLSLCGVEAHVCSPMFCCAIAPLRHHKRHVVAQIYWVCGFATDAGCFFVFLVSGGPEAWGTVCGAEVVFCELCVGCLYWFAMV